MLSKIKFSTKNVFTRALYKVIINIPINKLCYNLVCYTRTKPKILDRSVQASEPDCICFDVVELLW